VKLKTKSKKATTVAESSEDSKKGEEMPDGTPDVSEVAPSSESEASSSGDEGDAEDGTASEVQVQQHGKETNESEKLSIGSEKWVAVKAHPPDQDV